MRRQAIDQDEFFETAERLKAEGKDVTATVMLDALGGGSLRTIYKYLEEWQKKRPSVPPAPANEIPGPVQAAFGTAWRVATQEAGREVEAVKEAAQEEIKAEQAKFQEVLTAQEKVADENEALTKKVAELEEKMHKVEADCAARAATIEQLERQLKACESDRADRDKAREEAAELRGTVESLKGQNADLLSKLSSKD